MNKGFYRRYVHSLSIAVLIIFLFGCEESNTKVSTETGSQSEAVNEVADKTSVVSKESIETKAMAPKRLNISEVADDPVMLQSLRKAVATMRANSSKDSSSVEFRTSLQFWANTHGYFGPEGAANATNFQQIVDRRKPECLDYFQDDPYNFSEQKAKAVCAGFFEKVDVQFTPDSFSDNVWGTCQHTTPPVEQDPRFLPWHRLYLYYYERTLRKYSGNPDFALPYWNYFDYQSSDGLYLPPVVAEGESIQTNPLYDPLRTLWLNENKVAMNPQYASAHDAFQEPDFVSFSNSLEGTPHGMMHCAVGNGCSTAHMGWVPVAGNDPVFYMHHANVDRLWQCWMNQEAKGQTIDLAWAKANLGLPESWFDIAYEFVDENGRKVTKTIADAFSPEVLAVSYSNNASCPQIKQPLKQLKRMLVELESQGHRFSAFQMEDVQLKARPTSVSLKNMSESLRSNKGLVEKVAQLKPGSYLLLDNIMVKAVPSFTYGVYISNKQEPEKRELVTHFNFFGFGDHGDHGAHHGGGSLGSQRHYIEDDLAELDIQSAEDILVHFIPMSKVTGKVINRGEESPITIEKVSVITVL